MFDYYKEGQYLWFKEGLLRNEIISERYICIIKHPLKYNWGGSLYLFRGSDFITYGDPVYD